MKDWYGANAMQVLAQCDNLFLVISHQRDWLNGMRVVGWQAVLRELVALAVPRKLVDRTFIAESTASGQYVNVPLTYPLSAESLARLLDAPVSEVRAHLAEFIVPVD